MADNSTIAFEKDDLYVLKFELERAGAFHLKGKMSTVDVIAIDFDEVAGTYHVQNLDGNEEWNGVHSERNTAIMLYLHKRLGIKGLIAEEANSEAR